MWLKSMQRHQCAEFTWTQGAGNRLESLKVFAHIECFLIVLATLTFGGINTDKHSGDQIRAKATKEKLSEPEYFVKVAKH